MWIARNQNYNLYLFLSEKPLRWGKEWMSGANDGIKISEYFFPEITWDSEPLEVELSRKPRWINQLIIGPEALDYLVLEYPEYNKIPTYISYDENYDKIEKSLPKSDLHYITRSVLVRRKIKGIWRYSIDFRRKFDSNGDWIWTINEGLEKDETLEWMIIPED